MRHWFEVGYFKPEKLLIRRNLPDAGWEPLTTVFPDQGTAFIPQETLQEAAERGIEPSASANLPPAAAAAAAGADAEHVAEPEADAADLQIPSSILNSYGPAMTEYFMAGDAWLFLDAEHQVQGPFEGERMVQWFNAGYFWRKDLLIAHEGWDEYVELERVLAAAGEAYVAATVEADDAQAPSVTDVDSELSRRLAAASLAAEDCESDQEGEAGAAAEPAEAAADAAQLAQWYYLDTAGNSQGPYSSGNMAEWLQWEYFDGGTQVCLDAGADQYLPVSALYQAGEEFCDADPASAQARWDAAVAAGAQPQMAAAAVPHAGEQSGAAAAAEATASTSLESPTAFDSAHAHGEYPADTAELAQWFYLDTDGEAQGPFDAETMSGWCQAGYFDGGTQVSCHYRFGTFLQLCALYGEGYEFSDSTASAALARWDHAVSSGAATTHIEADEPPAAAAAE